ncbi:transmembrane protein, putative (macronuclear) [Tetrahymena thermophila SB210]|uniref:Transmembrane protein, putative n=1 Tax=Tetrahymena thermophila (strain SB210) TaxID=312017 RepID=Q24FF5_TETTS|nr:transmembrane protein, putative [Tetrahymena thermophila SB210]EAS06503.1 transmembrane protein, putative [Tetrahymena thermophila SB210]|eukprot:XP_001026748.1 transmembrane protein, putative [Tetrahymena thermophila SB210]
MNTVLPIQGKTKQYDEVKSIDTESQSNQRSTILKSEKSQNKKWSKKRKYACVAISLAVILCIAGVATFCAIYFKDHSKIEGRIVKSGSAEVNGQQIKYHQIDLNLTFKDSTQSKVTFFSTQQKKQTTNIQKNQESQGQEKEIEQTCYTAKMEGQDQTYRFCNQQQVEDPNKFYYETFFNADDLIQQLNQNDKQDSNSRNLQQQDQDGSKFIIYEEDGKVKIFNQQIHDLNNQLSDQGLQLEYQYLEEANVKQQQETVYNSNQSRTFSLQVENLENPYKIEQNSDDKQTIDSKNKRILFSLKKVVKHVVSAVQKCGPIIGAAVGAIAGGIVAFPEGIIAGAQIGYEIGSYAQAAAKTCLPKNSSGNVTFHCDAKQGIKEGLIIAGGKIAKQAIPKNFTSRISAKIFGFRRK